MTPGRAIEALRHSTNPASRALSQQPCPILMLTQHSHSVAADPLPNYSFPTAHTHGLPGTIWQEGRPSAALIAWVRRLRVFLHGFPDQLVISQSEPSTSLRCKTGRLALFLSWVSGDTRRSSKITSILLPDNHKPLSLWHISCGAMRLRKNRKWGRAAGRERACHYNPLFFWLIIRGGHPET